MSELHKYLNKTPSMCDLQFNTDGAHTQRTFCSQTAYLGLWPFTPKMSKKLLWTFYFFSFPWTVFFSSEVTALYIFLESYAQCLTCLYTDIETACRSTVALSKSLLVKESVSCGWWSYMLGENCPYFLRTERQFHVCLSHFLFCVLILFSKFLSKWNSDWLTDECLVNPCSIYSSIKAAANLFYFSFF